MLLHYLGKQVKCIMIIFSPINQSYTLQLQSLKQHPVYLHDQSAFSSITTASVLNQSIHQSINIYFQSNNRKKNHNVINVVATRNANTLIKTGRVDKQNNTNTNTSKQKKTGGESNINMLSLFFIDTGLKSLPPFLNNIAHNAQRQAVPCVDQALSDISHVSNWRLIHTTMHIHALMWTVNRTMITTIRSLEVQRKLCHAEETRSSNVHGVLTHRLVQYNHSFPR